MPAAVSRCQMTSQRGKSTADFGTASDNIHVSGNTTSHILLACYRIAEEERHNEAYNIPKVSKHRIRIIYTGGLCLTTFISADVLRNDSLCKMGFTTYNSPISYVTGRQTKSCVTYNEVYIPRRDCPRPGHIARMNRWQ